MKTLAILSRKGGTGKTTLALHLSVAASQAGHTTALIDLDPQASACKWADIRNDDAPVVISAHESRLSQVLHKAEQNGVTLAVLDTPPKTDALDAAEASNFVLIPCKPAMLELHAIGSTIKIVKMAGVASSIVFNAVPARSTMLMKAKEAVEVYETPCAPCVIGNRILFSHSVMDGQTAQEFDPTSKASDEIRILYNYISKQMGI